MREDSSRHVSNAQLAFTHDYETMRRQLIWTLQCPAAVMAAYFLMVVFHVSVETQSMLWGTIGLAAAILFVVLMSKTVRAAKKMRTSRTLLLDAMASQGAQMNHAAAQEHSIEPLLRMIPQEYRNAGAIGSIAAACNDHTARDFSQATSLWDNAMHHQTMRSLSAQQNEQANLYAQYQENANMARQTDFNDAQREFEEQDSRTQTLRQRNHELRSVIQAHGIEPETVLARQ